MSDTQPAVGNDNEAAEVVVRSSGAGFGQEIFAGLHHLSAEFSRPTLIFVVSHCALSALRWAL